MSDTLHSGEHEEEDLEQDSEFSQAFSDCADGKTATYAQDAIMTHIGTCCLAEISEARSLRRMTEERWLKDLRQYKGIYEPDVLERIGAARSKAYVKSTRVKVKTIDARVCDLLFPDNTEKNFSISATDSPSLDDETKKEIFASVVQELQREPTENELNDAVKKYADKKAGRMSTVVSDQLVESRYKLKARKVIHSAHLYGTGILKAPLVQQAVKQRYKFNTETKRYETVTEKYTIPFLEHVPVWRFYPDMTAAELEHCRYVYERHLFTQKALSDLRIRSSFNASHIENHIDTYPNGNMAHEMFENQLKVLDPSSISTELSKRQLYEVWERWGWFSGKVLSDAGYEIPDDRIHESFFANVWLFPDGTVIKCALQPLTGTLWPYHIYYCDKDETSFFGEGVPAIMRDDQDMINAATRMVLDNAAMTAGDMYEINMDLLAPGENATDIRPFKVWRRVGGQDSNAQLIRPIRLNGGLEYLMPIIDLFKANADDITAIPRYMQGQNATQGAAGTASGMSMLMASASIVLKDLVGNYDEGITRTLIESLYRWNMQFSPDDSIKGDYDVKALGTASLMAKEVRAQQLDQFAAMTANQIDAPLMNRAELLRHRAKAHDMPDIVLSDEEIKSQQAAQQDSGAAQMQAQMQQLQMMQLQAQLQKMQAEAARIQSETAKNTATVKATEAQTAKTEAEIEKTRAETTHTKVETQYAAMNTGALVEERGDIAPVGDAVLKSAGYQDSSAPDGGLQSLPVQPTGTLPPQYGNGQDKSPMTAPSPDIGANVGQNVGMHVGEGNPL
jgi:hypothetical protein